MPGSRILEHEDNDNDFLKNQQNIHDPGKYLHPHNILSTKIDKEYLDNLNQQVNDKDNIIHRTILDHSLRNIMSNFTNDIIRLVDDIMVDIEQLNLDTSNGDTLDWMVQFMNVVYKIFQHLIHKNNCLNVGILIIIISIFVHYFNVTQPNNSK